MPGPIICFVGAKGNTTFSCISPATVQNAIGQEALRDSPVPVVPRLGFRLAEVPAIDLMCKLRTY